ncbi:type VI secretion system Vgr family protein [Puniceibacterium sp. IMCC21224]|uniref:type VI secretion system Vgr family protein n=1 Tax=Puniceibacterium sp. IMCC21224 TaxID=1618204 RepID=UPI00064DFB84|nr:type VI secretion system tip protein TssI/VgrG [Puniceibacterium sp. IMCC21224]KMK65225.1 Rhs element Vgr protein [Puniceibacterium sp. IMCC21224]
MAIDFSLDRIAYLVTPLPLFDGNDALLFAHLAGRDEVSQCYRYSVLARSFDPNIAANDLLGKTVTVAVAADPDSPFLLRFFSGIVDQFRFEGNDDEDRFMYRLILRPQLWMLSKTTDNRIFQDMSATDIITSLLTEHNVLDYELNLRGSPEVREYCVQYGESDLDFIQRLMEEEGIFYHFIFNDGEHKLILSDDPTELFPAQGIEQLRFEPNYVPGRDGAGVVTKLSRTDRIVSGSHTLTDYNFETPSADLIARVENLKGHDNDGMERYHYPGRYRAQGIGENLAGIRNQQDQAHAHQIWADSTAPTPCSGNLFQLLDYPRDEENIRYMILAVDYDIWDGQYSSRATRDRPEGFAATYRMVPSDAAYRPLQRTPRPVMKGPQTAIVVGPAGEEIYTDEYARVKVQFYWDREGGLDEHSTCFIRVSSVWAGSGWGFIQIPRIGQEVIVDFLDGDPDRPIITGRVYNAEQMPPYALPGNATQSGWKSNSSKGGGGWNELRFEDLKGSEEVYFQAEKDHNEWIKNNETRNVDNDFAETVGHDAKQDVVNDRDETVGNNKTTAVGVNRDINIGNNDTETVGNNRSLTVGVNETIMIGANSDEIIGANHSQTVGANQTVMVAIARTDTVGAVETRTVGAAQINTVGAMRQMSVGATQSHDVGLSDSWEIGTNQSVEIGKDQGTKIGQNYSLEIAEESVTAVGKNMSVTVGEDYTVEVGKNIVVKAVDSITFTCGKANFQMKKDGTIVIEGKDVSITGSGKINVKASKDITMKGSKINQN